MDSQCTWLRVNQLQVDLKQVLVKLKPTLLLEQQVQQHSVELKPQAWVDSEELLACHSVVECQEWAWEDFLIWLQAVDLVAWEASEWMQDKLIK